MSTSVDETGRSPFFTTDRVAAVVLGVLYGLVARLVFGSTQISQFLSTLSFGFLGVVPIAIGAITVYVRYRRDAGQVNGFFDPWLTSLFFLAVVAVLTLELFICIVMASPLFFIMSSIGGVITKWVLQLFERRKRVQASFVILFLIAPYILTPLEQRMPQADLIRTVRDSIDIDADAMTIWANITEVAPIQPEEQRLTLLQIVGIPRPLQATLDGEGVGAVRHGQFEYGLRFEEVITHWQPGERLTFDIDAQPTDATQEPFNMIGGAYFDILSAEYAFEPLEDGQMRLHLSSEYRLSTRINAYGGLWVDVALHDFQQAVLSVVKRRSEA